MLGIDVSGKLHNALNGLNFVKAFYTAYNSSSGLSQEKVSILHMEAFLFLMAHQDHDGIPLLNLQEALGHAQAKMQRLAVALQKVGWITLKKDPNDGRQRIVYLTEKGLALFDQLSPCFSAEKTHSVYQDASQNMKDSIVEKAVEREVLMGAENIVVAGASIVAKASMNATVEVGGVSAEGKTGDARIEAERNERLVKSISDEQVKKSLEFELKTALRAAMHGESGKVEVGAGYVRTDRGIVTHKVLLKRLRDLQMQGLIDIRDYQLDMFGVAEYLKNASNLDYEKMLTPTPKTKREKLELRAEALQHEIEKYQSAIREMERKFGLDHIWDVPHLKGTDMNMRRMLQKAQMELAVVAKELVLLEANEEMLKELEAIPNMTPEQEAELDKWEKSRGNPLDDFDVTEFPTTGATEKE